MKTIDTADVLLRHLPEQYLSATVKQNIKLAYYALEEGHVCIAIDQKTEGLLHEESPENDNPLYAIERFNPNTYLFYLRRLWAMECRIFEHLQALIAYGKPLKAQRQDFLQKNADFIVQKLFKPYTSDGITPIDWQKIAALNAFTQQFALITGGPGTGKTTTVAKLLYLLFMEQVPQVPQVALVAQTGKAAARLKESLNKSVQDKHFGIGHLDSAILKHFMAIEPSTIHRLLGSRSRAVRAKHHGLRPIEHDVLIVDEASMADVPLLNTLMDALKPSTRLFLLGDRNQLTSVDVGSVFSDLCLAKLDVEQNLSMLSDASFFNAFTDATESEALKSYQSKQPNALMLSPIIELKRSYRFQSNEQIAQLANSLMASNTTLDLQAFMGNQGKEVKIFERKEALPLSGILDIYTAMVECKTAKDALKALNHFKILCALKQSSAFGTASYNQLVEQHLQKHYAHHDEINFKPNDTFYEHQPIIITANDYLLELYNGDVGIIRKNANGELRAYFEHQNQDEAGALKEVLPASLQAYETAYAISIHKSQGSEFDTVLLILPDDEKHKILSKELLYTGITRAKKQVYILAPTKVIEACANKESVRVSGLIHRINASQP